jgi:PAS domain S-box-containing protein
MLGNDSVTLQWVASQPRCAGLYAGRVTGGGMIDQQTYVWSLAGLALFLVLAILYLIVRLRTVRHTDAHRQSGERALLRTVIDNVPDFIYAKDVNGRFLVANVAVARNLGMTPDQLLGKHDFDLFPQEVARSFHEDEQALIRSGIALVERDEIVTDATGRPHNVLTSKIPVLDERGRVTGLVGIGRDVTLRTRLLAEMQAARDAAEAANRAKSEFLANMSHEIRTPINGVLGMAELLLDTSLDHTQSDYARTIHESGKALLTVINDILDFSKIEAGKLDIERVAMDLRATVEDVARMIAFQAHQKRLELTLEIDPALPSAVKGDPGRVRQILTNLGGNAVKFTSAGEVAIEAKVQESDAAGTRVRFEVRDTGMGIPADRIDRLFLPFSQVDASTTRRFGGTGLGLSIVRRLVDLMGGECGVSSVPGSGSTFWFTLYFAAAEPNFQQGDAPSPPILTTHELPVMGAREKRVRVLLAEDNPVNQKVGSRLLERIGCTVEVAADGKEALRAWESGGFDLILMDCQMPEMDGYEATRQIRSRELASHRTPIVALTAHALKGAEEECRAAGMNDFLTKPIDSEALRACIERFVTKADPQALG